jgi:hypothetical protein
MWLTSRQSAAKAWRDASEQVGLLKFSRVAEWFSEPAGRRMVTLVLKIGFWRTNMDGEPEFKRGYLGSYADIFKLYEDGKKRRYDLLFAVNGGVFAIVNGVKALGAANLPGFALPRIAIAMTVLTGLFGYDIWQFGKRMREKATDDELLIGKGIFAKPGRIVLCGICAVLMFSWLSALIG